MNPVSNAEVKVWDAPTRVFHWLLVLCCLGSVLTQESERWRLVHVTLGYSMAGLVVFRLVWGFIGTRYARFSEFIKGPSAIKSYVVAARTGQPEHTVGHNPVGALAVVAVLTLVAVLAATGYLNYNDLAGDWTEKVHEGAANVLYLVVGLHVLGVIFSSRLHKENLVRAMVTGNKVALPSAGIVHSYRVLAVLLLLAVLGKV